jgi:PPOX class probable F420-dependent enzyme
VSEAPTPSRTVRGDDILRDPLVRELVDARLIAVLSTLEQDGSIHAIPVWYAAAGDAIVFATGSESRKVRNIRRDPRATVTLHDSRPGMEICGASIRGTVEVVEGGAAVPLIEQVHRQYVTAEGLELPEVVEFLAFDDVVLRFRPESAVTWDERRSAAADAVRRTGTGLELVPTSPRAAHI